MCIRDSYFTIQIEGENGTNVVVDIRDMSGRVVRKNVINSVIQSNKIESNIQLDDFTPGIYNVCLLYTSPSPRDRTRSRMPSSA